MTETAPKGSIEADEQQRLRALGIELVSEEKSPRIYAEYVRVARGFEHADRQVVGLCPGSFGVGIPTFAVHLGMALATISGSTVAYVDANVRWPAALPLIQQKLLPPADRQHEDFATLWIGGMLAILVPRRVGVAGQGLTSLRIALSEARELFGHILVDITGFHAIGDHLAVYELLDGVALVGQVGETTDSDLLSLQAEIPPGKLIGAALVG